MSVEQSCRKLRRDTPLFFRCAAMVSFSPVFMDSLPGSVAISDSSYSLPRKEPPLPYALPPASSVRYLAISVGQSGMFWKEIKCRINLLSLRSEMPVCRATSWRWTDGGQVVSPLRRTIRLSSIREFPSVTKITRRRDGNQEEFCRSVMRQFWGPGREGAGRRVIDVPSRSMRQDYATRDFSCEIFSQFTVFSGTG